MIFWIAPVLGYLSGKAQDYIDFLRSIPNLIAPKPSPVGGSYIPPFTGGQCVGVQYYVGIALNYNGNPVDYTFADWNYVSGGGISGNAPLVTGPVESVYATSTGWAIRSNGIVRGGIANPFFVPITGIKIVRADGQTDSCGNVPNPSAPPSIASDGLFNPSNPVIGDGNGTLSPGAIVLAPAAPLALLGAVLAGYGAAMGAARAAGDALEAAKKIAEGLDALKDLWDKLREFLNDWEKNRPKKRDVVRQTYGQLIGDGALDFFPSDNQKYQSIQLDVVITTIPMGFGKFFGSFSPHRYRYKELGYIAFYSTTQGILEVRALEFKRTSLQIPKLAVGFIYHLGLDDQIKGYAFGTFSVEKS